MDPKTISVHCTTIRYCWVYILLFSNDDLSDDDDDDDYDIYYGDHNEDLDDGRGGPGVGPGSLFNNNDDPEYFAYECLSVAQVKDLLTESITSVCSSIQVCTV